MKQHHCYLLATLALISSACHREVDPIERAALQAVTTTATFTKASRMIHVGQGDFLIVGSQKSAQGDLDLYVTRHNLVNGKIWEQVVAHTGDDLGRAITYYNGFCYASASTSNNQTKIVKLDAATGAVIVDRQVSDMINADIVSDQGTIYLAGATTNVDINKPGFNALTDLSDIRIDKLDANLDHVGTLITGDSRQEYSPRLCIYDGNAVFMAKSEYQDSSNMPQERMFFGEFSPTSHVMRFQTIYNLNMTSFVTANVATNANYAGQLNTVTQDYLGRISIHDLMNTGVAASHSVDITGSINSIYSTPQGYLVASNYGGTANISRINGSTWTTQSNTTLSATAFGLTAGNIITIGEGAAFINSNNIQNFVFPVIISDNANTYAHISLIVIDQYGTIQPQ